VCFPCTLHFEGAKVYDLDASRKIALKLALSRMNLQKNKNENLIKNQKREVAALLADGKVESARIKVPAFFTCISYLHARTAQVEHIIREEYIIDGYQVLELFCELLLVHTVFFFYFFAGALWAHFHNRLEFSYLQWHRMLSLSLSSLSLAVCVCVCPVVSIICSFFVVQFLLICEKQLVH
jgi:hypothetical protein